MSDLLKHITELVDEGGTKQKQGTLTINFFDALDNCGREVKSERITDTSPASSFCDRPGEKDKP